MNKKSTFLSAVILLTFPLLSQAFVSYGTQIAPEASPLTAPRANQYPASMPNANSNGNKETLRMPCENGGPYSNLTRSPLAGTQTHTGQAPIAKAAMDLAPVGWNIHDMTGSQEQAAWNVEGTWMQALSQAANSIGSCAFIDWNTKKITLTKNRNGEVATQTYASASPMVTNNAPGSNHVVPASRPGQAADYTKTANPFAMPAAPSVNPNLWTLTDDKTLKQNLMVWGQRSGWRIVWKIKNMDFRITHTATLSGTFVEAIEQLLLAYENGNTPIAANLYEHNKVIEFVDHTPFKRNIIQ